MRFISYAQNNEDVLLWRALGHVRDGFYIDVGANDPVHDLPEERQKAHRSRLKRMKDKGLFKNE